MATNTKRQRARREEAQSVNYEIRNAELYRRILQADVAAVDELILANYGLAITIARNFVKRAPQLRYLKDDLESEALLALTKEVHRLAEKRPDIQDVGKYLTTAISHSLAKAGDESPLFGPKHSTAKKVRSEAAKLELSGSYDDRQCDLKQDAISV